MIPLNEIVELTARLFNPAADSFQPGDLVTIATSGFDLYLAIILPDDVFQVREVNRDGVVLSWPGDSAVRVHVTWVKAQRMGLRRV